jgi:hypothetical protein
VTFHAPIRRFFVSWVALSAIFVRGRRSARLCLGILPRTARHSRSLTVVFWKRPRLPFSYSRRADRSAESGKPLESRQETERYGSDLQEQNRMDLED